MRRKYAIHPMDYAIGENEKFYSDMAARGWFLRKRGIRFSRFEPGEPQRMRYRIELSQPGFLDGAAGLPEEQIGVYEDCGWQFVTSCGLVHVFSAPEGSGAPEFYTSPEQQAATLRGMRRSYVWGMLTTAVLLGMNTLFYLSVGDRGLHSLQLDLYGALVTNTALVLFAGVCLLGWLLSSVYSSWRLGCLYRQLKRGVPLDHAPKKRYPVYRTVSALLLAAGLFTGALVLGQFAGTERYAMPARADGPYITFAEAGVEGERVSSQLGGESRVEHSRSLLCESWTTREFVADPGNSRTGTEDWLYQEVYQLRREEMLPGFIRALMSSGAFARSPEEYRPVTVPGLEEAWVSRLEIIARRGNTVYKLTASEQPGRYDSAALLNAIAEKQL
ncbi:MAG: DUF2812 domain-containing protein [Clostridiales bacterium]|nr:DUF2812 domain-containing protein [Clostridiales bacterium]